MKWTQTTPAAIPVSYAQAAAHLRLYDDTDRDYVLDLIAAAVEYAETALESSLVTRTITATWFATDADLWLPRGPVQSITTVVGLGNRAVAGCAVEGYGTADLLVAPSNGYQPPLTAVYQAGYGDNAADVPADIRLAIRQHVYSLYENRQPSSDLDQMPVPGNLADFYRGKKRGTGVG